MKRQSGFSLIETIIALSIFVVSSLIVADIFVRSSQTGRTIVMRTRALRETRAAMEDAIRLIRFGTIDYDFYAPSDLVPATLAVPVKQLVLRDARNRRTLFYAVTTPLCASGTSSCLVMERDGQIAPVTPSGVEVTSASFYVSPVQDPFRAKEGGGFFANDQPRVTLVLSLSIPSSRGSGGNESLTLRTTVSSRVYKR